MRLFYIHVLSTLLFIPYVCAQDPIIASLQEIEMEQPDLVIMMDEQMRNLCDLLLDIWSHGDYQSEPWVIACADRTADQISYETMLQALSSCITKLEKTVAPEHINAFTELQELYDDLQEEFDELRSHLMTRRRKKCKVFCKVITQCLSVCKSAHIKTADITCLSAGKINTQQLALANQNGVVKATNGLLESSPIQTTDIADDAVTNEKLADNSVTSNNLATMSILPTHLNFNAIDMFNAEPNLLRLYRGTIASNGTIVSGAGFSVNKTGTGQYTITLSNGYTGTTSYQIIGTPSTGVDRNINSAATSGSAFTIETRTDANALVDQQFHFFTLGPLT